MSADPAGQDPAPPSARRVGADAHEALIQALSRGLVPTRRLAPPGRRALLWLLAVAALALAIGSRSDLAATWLRLGGAPTILLAAAGSTLTACLAVIAAFQSSVPGRSRLWAIAPLPAALLWLRASGSGCLRAWLAPGAHTATLYQERSCLVFILLVSLPLSLLAAAMLRRACPLRPGLTAGLGGLAAAAAAATLLDLFHPYDAAWTDLAVQLVAVALVVAANRMVGGRLLGRRLPQMSGGA